MFNRYDRKIVSSPNTLAGIRALNRELFEKAGFRQVLEKLPHHVAEVFLSEPLLPELIDTFRQKMNPIRGESVSSLPDDFRRVIIDQAANGFLLVVVVPYHAYCIYAITIYPSSPDLAKKVVMEVARHYMSSFLLFGEKVVEERELGWGIAEMLTPVFLLRTLGTWYRDRGAFQKAMNAYLLCLDFSPDKEIVESLQWELMKVKSKLGVLSS